MHVYRRGEEPVERRLRSDDRENLWSVSKTFVSVALGIAEAEGRLALDDPALTYYPELKGTAAPGLEQVTLRHLLTMTSGSPHSWFADEPVVVPDLAADFFATPLAHEPGSYFSYTGTGPYVAARALRAATGASVRDYLMPRVFGPLAIHNPQWHTCPLGHPVAESDLFLRTSELARFGRLLLDDGRHEGRQLVPAGYCARIAAGERRHGQRPRGPGVPPGAPLRPRRLVRPRRRHVQHGGPLRPALHRLPPREAVVTDHRPRRGGLARTSITTLVTEELLNRL